MTSLVESVETPRERPPVIEAGPEPAAPRRPRRFPAFDGLRAIAAVTVVVVHVAFVSGLTPRNPNGVGMYTARLEIGVSVFFLISGYVLTYNYADRGRSLSKREFWLARISRLYPVYLFVLLISLSMVQEEWHARSHAEFWQGIVLTPLVLQGWTIPLAARILGFRKLPSEAS